MNNNDGFERFDSSKIYVLYIDITTSKPLDYFH